MLSKKTEKKQRNDYKDACWKGYCPTLEEKENERVKELADRLKSVTDRDTLTNVLDWQNRNVTFWFERYPMPEAILAPLLGFFFITAVFLITNPAVWFWSSTVLLTVFVTSLSITVYMINGYRKLPPRTLFNIFLPSLPINSVLDNKLCVCRDYAKLTASLLLNIYPDREIYFVHARSHVATGIMVSNKLYVLDKYLPLVTIDKWHEKWNKKWFSPKLVEKVKDGRLEKVKLKHLLPQKSQLHFNRANLEKELERQLNVHRSTKDAEGDPIKLLHWKKGAKLYSDDEIVNYSLSQRLKTIISAQAIEVKLIKRIIVEQNKDDLIFLLGL
jgi:predicted transglutaminase-like protease